jgi:Mg/Co/Ni transporter MgtE
MKTENFEQNNFVSRNKEIQKEMIRSIESLSIGSIQRANIILVYLGLKPATEIDIYTHNDSAEKVISAIEAIGLKTKIKREFKQKDKDVIRISVASNQENLEKLEKVDPSKDHEEYGRLMGYPETAIGAFLNKEKKLEYNHYLDDEDLVFFITMSKEDHGEEVKTLKKWSNAIKEHAPDLYIKLKGK